jgi:hypothetical protein
MENGLQSYYAFTYKWFLSGLGFASCTTAHAICSYICFLFTTLSGDVFDDAATGQGLLNYFLKALNCGAISETEALATGLTVAEIRSRSFNTILINRRKK